jgi:magnesium-transporting ATPase (P-type)
MKHKNIKKPLSRLWQWNAFWKWYRIIIIGIVILGWIIVFLALLN